MRLKNYEDPVRGPIKITEYWLKLLIIFHIVSIFCCKHITGKTLSINNIFYFLVVISEHFAERIYWGFNLRFLFHIFYLTFILVLLGRCKY